MLHQYKTFTTMTYHILNGDSLAHSFPEANLKGEIIVVREALVEGNLSGGQLNEFWQSRAKYIGVTEMEYHNHVVKEFEKITNAPDNAEFNLWFEYDLFCQVNMWFVLSLINDLSINKKVYAVYTSHLSPTHKQFWNGFGSANATELRLCFGNRIPLNEADLKFGQDLWLAYKTCDLDELSRLANNRSLAFPYLQEVVQAHLDRFPKDGKKGRPERVLEEIIQTMSTDFPRVVQEFWNRESIYGFGDTQVKQIYDKVIHSR